MDERQLIEKLRLVEALFEGTSSEGERHGAASALERIRSRLAHLQQSDPPIEYRFRMEDMWARRLFVALLRRYGISPYRYSGQRYTTVMAWVPKSFVDETLWPEFTQLNEVLSSYLEATTERVIRQGVHEDSSEAEVRKALPER
jgi:hypothetical protein